MKSEKLHRAAVEQFTKALRADKRSRSIENQRPEKRSCRGCQHNARRMQTGACRQKTAERQNHLGGNRRKDIFHGNQNQDADISKAVDHIQDYVLQAFSVPAAPHRFETCGVFPSLFRVTESLLFPSSPAFYAPPPLCMTPFSAKTFLCLRFRQIFFVLFSSSLQKSFISCTHSGHNFSVY